ncbi:MAG: S46 family peptidase, partial [Sphingomonadales bacterium]
PLMKLVNELEKEGSNIDLTWAQLDQQLKSIMPEYLDMKESFKKGQFIPDANSTLRLTYGYIKRYKPNDAEIHLPYTTLKGVFEKANTAADYRLPSVVADQLRIKDVPVIFKDKESGEVAVAFLYNLDTTGGNSGSAVLDAEGNLIGVNFDRSFTATINDYAWNDQYSRSIGCDIRYVLFVIKYVGKANHLLTEMGLSI